MFKAGLGNTRLLFRRTIKPQLSHSRGFKKIEVSSPFGLTLLRITKISLQGLLFFYGTGTLLYFGSYLYLKDYQQISSDLSILPKIYFRLAIYNEEIKQDNSRTELLLIKTLKSIAEEKGLQIESDDPKDAQKFKMLNLEQLKAESKDWQNTYLDIVTRLGLVKFELNDVQNSNKLIQYSLNVPMDIGSKDLKVKSLIVASKISTLLENNYDKSEKYLLDSIKFNEYYNDNIRFVDNQGSLLLDVKNSSLNKNLYDSLLELGIVYTKTSEYSKSLEIFLNLLQYINENDIEFIKPSDKPLLKNYIGEILYKKGLISNSIDWCRQSFKESRNYSKTDLKSAYISKQALGNLIKLYEKIGDEELKAQAQEEFDSIDTNFVTLNSWNLVAKLFS